MATAYTVPVEAPAQPEIRFAMRDQSERVLAVTVYTEGGDTVTGTPTVTVSPSGVRLSTGTVTVAGATITVPLTMGSGMATPAVRQYGIEIRGATSSGVDFSIHATVDEEMP